MSMPYTSVLLEVYHRRVCSMASSFHAIEEQRRGDGVELHAVEQTPSRGRGAPAFDLHTGAHPIDVGLGPQRGPLRLVEVAARFVPLRHH